MTRAGAVGAIVYLLTPAASGSLLGSWPLTPLGTIAFVAAAAIAWLAWRLPAERGARTALFIFAALIVARAGIALIDDEPGFVARYYANDAWTGGPQWSPEYRFADATRLDRALAFDAGDFPVHYLNSHAFSKAPAERDVATPMTAAWRGSFVIDAREPIVVDLRSAGSSTVSIDESTVVSTGQAATQQLTLDRGPHSIEVRYRKPAGVAGSLRMDLRRGNGEAIDVYPDAGGRSRATMASLVDAIMILALLGVALSAALQTMRSESRLGIALGAALVAALGVQGYFAALPFRRFHTLTSGDDWLGFESAARNILQHGLLMPLDAPIGAGVPYFYHPFYPYLLAAIHALTGESLFGPILFHFLLLAATGLVMFALVRPLFGMAAAVCGVAALVVIFELDFIRYYTITLLSENLYVFTVSCCLLAFARWAASAQTSWLVMAGVWGGISSATRPVMLMFAPLAAAAALAIAYRHLRQPRPIAAPLTLAAAWTALVLPFTLRNWIVSKQFVLISSGQGGAVIEHNVPKPIDPAPYLAAFHSGAASTVAVLWRVLIEHPSEMIALQFKKLGFTFGMIHWFEGYRPHPELLAVSILYVAMLVMSKTMRRAELWPVHAFVFSHWGSMTLTSPWNYGYRMILPAYVYTSTLSVAAAVLLMQSYRTTHR